MKRIFVIAVAVLTFAACGGGNTKMSRAETGGRAVTAADDGKKTKPVEYTFKVLAEYPHDTGAYTQGFLWHDGSFYEGTGQNGRSELRRVEPATGRVLQSVKLDRQYFGEGITLLDGRIYQLTWVSGRAFVYDADDFRQIRSFSYDGEGWGLTTDGSMLYMSDGSENIYVRDPQSFEIVRSFRVTSSGLSVNKLNELEWIDGKIWANRYSYIDEQIFVIDPADGTVCGVIDLAGLQSEADSGLPGTDVLNGIAYDSSTGDIYVTGKNWNKVYRIALEEKK